MRRIGRATAGTRGLAAAALLLSCSKPHAEIAPSIARAPDPANDGPTVTSTVLPPAPSASIDATAPGAPDEILDAGDDCAGLHARFFAIFESARGKACAAATDCACISRIDVSGGPLLSVNTAVVAEMNALSARYIEKGCHVGSRAGPPQVCRPACKAGSCGQ